MLTDRSVREHVTVHRRPPRRPVMIPLSLYEIAAVADGRGDLAEAERDHARVARGPVMHSDMLRHATAGTISSAYRKPHTCWQHPAALTRGHDLQ